MIGNDQDKCRRCGDRDWYASATCTPKHQPAPDVAGLAEALESLIKGYVSLLEAGMDRITSLGGDCDPVPVMEQNDPWLRDARATLAAHYKQQEGEA